MIEYKKLSKEEKKVVDMIDNHYVTKNKEVIYKNGTKGNNKHIKK